MQACPFGKFSGNLGTPDMKLIHCSYIASADVLQVHPQFTKSFQDIFAEPLPIVMCFNC